MTFSAATAAVAADGMLPEHSDKPLGDVERAIGRNCT